MANFIFPSGVNALPEFYASSDLGSPSLPYNAVYALNLIGVSGTGVTGGIGEGTITVTQTGSTLYISGNSSYTGTVVGGSNLGNGGPIYTGTSSGILQFNTITGTNNITVYDASNLITVSGNSISNFTALSGTTISGSTITGNTINFGTAKGITLSGNTIYENGLQVINSGVGAGSVTVTNSNGTLTISGVDAGTITTGTNLGTGQVVFTGVSANALQFNTIGVTGSLGISTIGNIITISGVDAGTITGGTNLGTGGPIYTGTSGANLQFNTITGTNNITVYDAANLITVSGNSVVSFTAVSGTTISGSTITGNTINFGTASGLTILQPLSGSLWQGFIPSNFYSGMTYIPTYSNIVSQESYVNIYGTNGGSTTTANASIDMENRGSGVDNYPEYAAVRSRGSNVAITGIKINDDMGHFSWWGAEDTLEDYAVGAYVRGVATENWTTSANGTKMQHFITETSSTTQVNKFEIGPSGTGFVGTSTSPFGTSYFTTLNQKGLTVINSGVGAGSVTVTNNGNGTLTISGSAAGTITGGTNLGTTGSPIYTGTSGANLQFNTIAVAGSLGISTASNVITISGSAAGTITTGTNLGTGGPIFTGVSGGVLQFNTITGTNNITVFDSSNLITISGNSVVSFTAVSGTTISGSTITGNTINFLTMNGVNFSGNSITGNTISGNTLIIGTAFEVQNSASNVGSNNTFAGLGAGVSNVSGTQNTAFGTSALTANNNGNYNTAVGFNALPANTSGIANVAVGTSSLASNTTGQYNMALGISSLQNNTIGTQNVAIGGNALLANVAASNNVGIGFGALSANISGTQNVAIGTNSLTASVTGNFNTAIGANALLDNLGSENMAFGSSALQMNTSGNYNIGIGLSSLQNNLTSSFNTAIGGNALLNCLAGQNTAIGFSALSSIVSGSNNIGIGYNVSLSGTNDTNEIVIGNTTGSGSNTTTFGNTSTTGNYFTGYVNASTFIPSCLTGIKANINLTINNQTVLTSQTGTITIGIPVTAVGHEYKIISTVSSALNSVKVSGIGCTLNGTATVTLSSATIGTGMILTSDGANYWYLANLV